MEKLKRRIDKEANGLAIIIHNSYDNDDAAANGCGALQGTSIDGKAMIDTFTDLKFAIYELKNKEKSVIKSVFEAVAKYSEYPAGYRSIVIYFSGHGGENSMLYDNDGEEFDYEEIIVQPLKSQASSFVAKTSLLMFIDACRGSQSPLVGRLKKSDAAPTNMMIGYASREKFQALETAEGGGIWTNKLAAALKESSKPVVDILEGVKKSMPSNYKKEALPDVWNPKSDAGKICLKQPSKFSKEGLSK